MAECGDTPGTDDVITPLSFKLMRDSSKPFAVTDDAMDCIDSFNPLLPLPSPVIGGIGENNTLCLLPGMNRVGDNNMSSRWLLNRCVDGDRKWVMSDGDMKPAPVGAACCCCCCLLRRARSDLGGGENRPVVMMVGTVDVDVALVVLVLEPVSVNAGTLATSLRDTAMDGRGPTPADPPAAVMLTPLFPVTALDVGVTVVV